MVNWFSAGVSSSQQISWPVAPALASAQIFRPARLKVRWYIVSRAAATDCRVGKAKRAHHQDNASREMVGTAQTRHCPPYVATYSAASCLGAGGGLTRSAASCA